LGSRKSRQNVLHPEIYKKCEALADLRLDKVLRTISQLEARGQAPAERIRHWRYKLIVPLRMSMAFQDRAETVGILAQIEMCQALRPGTFGPDRSPDGRRKREATLTRLCGGAENRARARA
jgi:hypothetical protein